MQREAEPWRIRRVLNVACERCFVMDWPPPGHQHFGRPRHARRIEFEPKVKAGGELDPGGSMGNRHLFASALCSLMVFACGDSGSSGEDPIAKGEAIVKERACASCHVADDGSL